MGLRRGTVTAVTGGAVTVKFANGTALPGLPVARHRAPTVEDPDAYTAMPRVGDRVVVASTTDSVDDRIVIGVLP